MKTESTLWEEASLDAEAALRNERVTAAWLAVQPLWPYLAAATSPSDFTNRRALVAERIEAAVTAANGGDVGAYIDTLAGLDDRLAEDFDILDSQREAQCQSKVAAFLKQASTPQERGWAIINGYRGRKSEAPAGNNTTVRPTADGRGFHVRLHNTDVVTHHGDGSFSLDHGGFHTVTTQARMNQWLPSGYKVDRQGGRIHLNTPDGGRYEVSRGDTFSPEDYQRSEPNKIARRRPVTDMDVLAFVFGSETDPDRYQNAHDEQSGAYEGDPPDCPQCGGPGVTLGTLGTRTHYRCRNCGWDFNHKASATNRKCSCGKQYMSDKQLRDHQTKTGHTGLADSSSTGKPKQSSRRTAETHPPYYIREDGGKFKVVDAIGEVRGTFDSKDEARQQQKALYANVPGAAEKAEEDEGHTPKAVRDEGKKAHRLGINMQWLDGFYAGRSLAQEGRQLPVRRLSSLGGFGDGMLAGFQMVNRTSSFRKGAPFADYADFDECVSQNQDKDDPEAYCGKIKHDSEDSDDDDSSKESSRRVAFDDSHVSRYVSWARSKGHDPDDVSTLRSYESEPGVGRSHADFLADQLYIGGGDSDWRKSAFVRVSTKPVRTADGKQVGPGDRVFNYYDGHWGHVGDDIDNEGWFHHQPEDGSNPKLLNGERVTTVIPPGNPFYKSHGHGNPKNGSRGRRPFVEGAYRHWNDDALARDPVPDGAYRIDDEDGHHVYHDPTNAHRYHVDPGTGQTLKITAPGLGCPDCNWAGYTEAERAAHIRGAHPGEYSGPTQDMQWLKDMRKGSARSYNHAPRTAAGNDWNPNFDAGPVRIEYPAEDSSGGEGFNVRCKHCGLIGSPPAEHEAWDLAEEHNRRHPWNRSVQSAAGDPLDPNNPFAGGSANPFVPSTDPGAVQVPGMPDMGGAGVPPPPAGGQVTPMTTRPRQKPATNPSAPSTQQPPIVPPTPMGSGIRQGFSRKLRQVVQGILATNPGIDPRSAVEVAEATLRRFPAMVRSGADASDYAEHHSYDTDAPTTEPRSEACSICGIHQHAHEHPEQYGWGTYEPPAHPYQGRVMDPGERARTLRAWQTGGTHQAADEMGSNRGPDQFPTGYGSGTNIGPGYCPNCGSTNVSMGGGYSSTNPTGGSPGARVPRLGDPGMDQSPTISDCKDCGTHFAWQGGPANQGGHYASGSLPRRRQAAVGEDGRYLVHCYSCPSMYWTNDLGDAKKAADQHAGVNHNAEVYDNHHDSVTYRPTASAHTAAGYSPASGMGPRQRQPYKPSHLYDPIGWDQFDARPHPGSKPIVPGSRVMNHGKMDPAGRLVHIEDEHGNNQTVDKRSLSPLRRRSASRVTAGPDYEHWIEDQQSPPAPSGGKQQSTPGLPKLPGMPGESGLGDALPGIGEAGGGGLAELAPLALASLHVTADITGRIHQMKDGDQLRIGDDEKGNGGFGLSYYEYQPNGDNGMPARGYRAGEYHLTHPSGKSESFHCSPGKASGEYHGLQKRYQAEQVARRISDHMVSRGLRSSSTLHTAAVCPQCDEDAFDPEVGICSNCGYDGPSDADHGPGIGPYDPKVQ